MGMVLGNLETSPNSCFILYLLLFGSAPRKWATAVPNQGLGFLGPITDTRVWGGISATTHATDKLKAGNRFRGPFLFSSGFLGCYFLFFSGV